MKKIVTVQKRTVSYQCEVCGTKYRSKTAAKRCEKRKLEEKLFKIGDYVQVTPWQVCNKPGKRDKYYPPKGKIVYIHRPQLPDDEYENKWLGFLKDHGERMNFHVRLYRIRFKCPLCGREHEREFYAPELKKISK